VRKKNKKIRRKKKPNREKNQLNRLNLKKPTSSVWFRFYKLKIEKSEPNPNKKNQAKPEKNRAKTEQNRFEQVFSLKTKPKPVSLNRFRFLKKKFNLIIF
jgi:hypothetical protein